MNISKSLAVGLLANLFALGTQVYPMGYDFNYVKAALKTTNSHLGTYEEKSLYLAIKTALFSSSHSQPTHRSLVDIFAYLESLYHISMTQVVIPSELIPYPCIVCEDKDRYKFITPCCRDILCQFCFFGQCLEDEKNTICKTCSSSFFPEKTAIGDYLLELLKSDDFREMKSFYQKFCTEKTPTWSPVTDESPQSSQRNASPTAEGENNVFYSNSPTENNYSDEENNYSDE